MDPERFIEYLEGTLSPLEREKIEQSLRDDPEQRLEFELAKEIHEGLNALRHQVKAADLEPPAIINPFRTRAKPAGSRSGTSDLLPVGETAVPDRIHSSFRNLLTAKETAEYLRIPLPTVYYLVQRGQLPAIQIGGRWRIKKAKLDRDIIKENKAGQPTVLVVDDDEQLQTLFKVFLKKIGFSRVVVGTVKEALIALEKQRFDILFLDLKLPDGPAEDVYSAAKRIDPELSIVIITGYPDSEALDRILSTGPVTVLKKPLAVKQLQQTVRILGNKGAASLVA